MKLLNILTVVFRFHKDERVWITRAHGMMPSEKTATYERGTYYFFDVNVWKKVPKEFHLDYDKLEDRPSLPSNLAGAGGGAGGSQSTVGGHHPVSGSPQPLVPSQVSAPGVSGQSNNVNAL